MSAGKILKLSETPNSKSKAQMPADRSRFECLRASKPLTMPRNEAAGGFFSDCSKLRDLWIYIGYKTWLLAVRVFRILAPCLDQVCALKILVARPVHHKLVRLNFLELRLLGPEWLR